MLALLTLLIPAAEACSCMALTVAEKITRADVVFTGQVLKIEAPEVPSLPAAAVQALPQEEREAYWKTVSAGSHVIFQVKEAWKGVEAPMVRVGVGSGMCCDCTFGPAPFRIGETYTITAYSEEAPAISTCGAVAPSTPAEAVTAVLGEPKGPPTGDSLQGEVE